MGVRPCVTQFWRFGADPQQTRVDREFSMSNKTTAIILFVLARSEEHTSELQSIMRTSYDVFCLKKQNLDYGRRSAMDRRTVRHRVELPFHLNAEWTNLC